MRPVRARRSCHAVPGSSERFLAKAAELHADEVFLDLEDAVAPGDKEPARELRGRGAASTRLRPRTRRRARQRDGHAALLPRPDRGGRAGRRPARRGHAPQGPLARGRRDDGQAARPRSSSRPGSAGRIGIEAQIEDAAGLIACEAIAAASPRMETLVFGPGDYSASVGIPITTIGGAPEGYPGDHLNYVYSRLVVAARAAGIQAIDGPVRRRRATSTGLRARAAARPGARPRRQVDDPPGSDRGRQRRLHARPRGVGAGGGHAGRLRGRGPGAALFDGEMIARRRRWPRCSPQGRPRAGGAGPRGRAPRREPARGRVRPAPTAARAARAWSTGGSPSRPRPPAAAGR